MLSAHPQGQQQKPRWLGPGDRIWRLGDVPKEGAARRGWKALQAARLMVAEAKRWVQDAKERTGGRETEEDCSLRLLVRKRARFFTANLSCADCALGIQANAARFPDKVAVVRVGDSGAFSEWNFQNRDRQICRGDRILEANGVTGDAKEIMSMLRTASKTGDRSLSLRIEACISEPLEVLRPDGACPPEPAATAPAPAQPAASSSANAAAGIARQQQQQPSPKRGSLGDGSRFGALLSRLSSSEDSMRRLLG